MFARVLGIGARTMSLQIFFSVRKEANIRCRKDSFNLRRHFTGQQLGGEDGLIPQGINNMFPLFIIQRCDGEGHLIRLGPRALDFGINPALCLVDG